MEHSLLPLPQTAAGASQSLRYIGEQVSEGWSILFFPEGERTETVRSTGSSPESV
jgi:hypothetical protein